MESLGGRKPDNPVSFIQACVRGRRFLWTYHVHLRLQGRFVARQTILDAVDSYEIVEFYPDDKYLPSYLLLGRVSGDSIHVLFAADVLGDNVRVITIYRPSLEEWEADFKTRKTTP
ncbi:MAG TPA: DUF4258 domain-containing protein [Dehalococcoidia bacterium]|nr:DUF4258 domain-containing protein [Dehalococcoidia bacterium]